MDFQKEHDEFDDIDRDAIIENLMRENEELKRKAALKYFSMPPIIEEIKWQFGHAFYTIGEMDANRVAIYIMLFSAIWAMLNDILKTVLDKKQ
ncbi:MAG TPA: hypothetical protein VNG51_16870 [Ktedonobacteraceae bacterium]|nr:hypothetical protein [Ktedonobacteraceae bacterium]